MATVESASKKSTIVRAKHSTGIQQLALRTLEAIMPSLVERRAAQQFFTPRRAKSSPTWPGNDAFTVHSGDYSLRAWSWGEGPVVLLVHGWEGHAGHMQAFVAPLVSQGFKVVALDLPAHGQSSGRQASVLDMADGISAVAGAVGPVYAVIAHSLGATATALTQRPGPRPQGPGWRHLTAGRLVLLAPPEAPTRFALDQARQLGLSPQRTAGIVRRIRDHLGVDLEEIALSGFAPHMTVPLLIVHDPADRVVPFEHSQKVAAVWPGARLLSVAKVGHRRILSDPRVIAEAVSFVSEQK